MSKEIEAQVWDALRKVRYPGMSRDIVSFGFVKQVEVQGSGVAVELALSTHNPDAANQVKAETEEAETGETGEAESPCAGLETQDECDASPECQSVIGQPLKQNGPDAPCLEAAEFIACIPTQGCDDALTWFCVGGNAKPVLVNDGCGPEDAEICEPPVADPPACP